MTEAALPDDATGGLLSELTTMRVGGPADNVLVARSGDELVRHALDLWDSGEEWLLLGGGSNTVVCDEGFPGTVLLVRGQGIERVEDPELPESKAVSYTHLRAHETRGNLVCRLLLEKNFFNDTATTEIYTRKIVGSVRCV